MGTLTVSKLNDVELYRTNSWNLNNADVMEISLSGTNGYVSSKIEVGDLKKYIIDDYVNPPYQLFDIFYRTIKQTPVAFEIVNGAKSEADVYSAWPLFIDTTDLANPEINSSAPNWVHKQNDPNTGTQISSLYPTFWTELSSLNITNNFTPSSSGAIHWESVDVTVPTSITNSQYMTEYGAYGHTGRFLIDPIHKFVALPILNNSFIRNISLSGSDLAKIETDEFKSHAHTIPVSIGEGTGTSKVLYSYEAAGSESTNLTGGLETRPKNVRYCPYMQIANSFIGDSIVDMSAALSAISFATSGETQNFETSSAVGNKSVSPLTHNQAFMGSNQSLSSNGYQKLPGGLIMQWGSVSHTGDIGSAVDWKNYKVTFPTPFTTNVLNITWGNWMNSDATKGWTAVFTTQKQTITLIDFEYYLNEIAAYGQYNTWGANWFAIGY